MKLFTIKAMRAALTNPGMAFRAACNPHFFGIYLRFRRYTMVDCPHYVSNLILASGVKSMSGEIVECGTWRGGMIAGIARVLGPSRRYYLYDSFEGLPQVQSIDGPEAIQWQAKTKHNCTASEREAAEAMRLAGVKDPILVKGWFEETLPHARFESGIALLRMDADWYSSTKQILDFLFPSVLPDGLILIDDYYRWDGCSKAVHDYLSEHKRPERISCLGGVCFIRKRLVEQEA